MTPAELSQERILFACLDWGSGHTARSVGLLKQLQEQENELFLWCTPAQRSIFELYGIAATYLENAGFRFQFKGDGHFTSEMRRNAPGFLRRIKEERVQVRQLVSDHRISRVVSDHCYGFHSEKVPSIFITHQVFLPPKAGWLAQRIHRRWIKRFDEIWIMDDPQKRLAGKLSEAIGKSTYIGFYSRFKGQEISVVPGKIVGVVSGPEPYSEQLFHWILEKYGDQSLTLVSPKRYAPVPDQVSVINGWKEADREIASAELVISRNGYSTLMDLEILQKKAVLIPTPGQLEQEYLFELKTNGS